jgi:hypothetical protein
MANAPRRPDRQGDGLFQQNGNPRKSNPHVYEQAVKEWVVWAAFKFMGPEGGAEWMYSYNAENVLGA